MFNFATHKSVYTAPGEGWITSKINHDGLLCNLIKTGRRILGIASLLPHAMLDVKRKMSLLSPQKERPQSSISKSWYVLFLSRWALLPDAPVKWKWRCPIIAFGGNEAKLVTEPGLSKDCFRIAWETRLWGFMGSVDKNCSKKESVKRLLVGSRETYCSQVSDYRGETINTSKPKDLRKI